MSNQHHHHDEHRHDLFSRWMDERNHYFTGKYLTAKDFQDEQSYQISHHRWHQWGLHGYGIIWGLEVSLDHDACVRIEPGVAVDGWGRELVVARPVEFAVGELRHLLRQEERETEGAAECESDETAGKNMLLGLLYKTRDRDCVPVILNDEHPDQRKVHGRVKEYAKIGYVDYCEHCWSIPKPFEYVELPEVPRDQQTAINLHQHNCPDEHCACKPAAIVWPGCHCGKEGFLPLARLSRTDNAWTACDAARRYVPSPFFAEQLTHIDGISWQHGGETKLAEICKCEGPPRHWNAALEVHFDKPLANTENAQLLQLIQLIWNTVDDNDCDGDDQPQVVNIKQAVFDPNRNCLRIEFPYGRMAPFPKVRLRLIIDCDMLIDYRGRAVDGEHMHGQVSVGGRSGDGREGGVFQSWSTISKC